MRSMGHQDLLDVAEAYLMEPLVPHPEEFKKFREDVLYAPLEGTAAARRRTQAAAMAAMGLDLSALKAGQGLGRKARARVPKKEKADADTSES